MVHNSALASLSIDQTSHVVLFQSLGITLSQKSGPDKEQAITKTLIPEMKKNGGKLDQSVKTLQGFTSLVS